MKELPIDILYVVTNEIDRILKESDEDGTIDQNNKLRNYYHNNDEEFEKIAYLTRNLKYIKEKQKQFTISPMNSDIELKTGNIFKFSYFDSDKQGNITNISLDSWRNWTFGYYDQLKIYIDLYLKFGWIRPITAEEKVYFEYGIL